MHLCRFAICCFLFILPAMAQLDSFALRARFGPPLNRETFHMPAGFDLVVDYGPTNEACRLQVPALMPTNEKVSNTVDMKKRMYDFLAELVPAQMRGLELLRMSQSMGAVSIESIEYEFVTVVETRNANHPFGDTITVTFKNGNCGSADRP